MNFEKVFSFKIYLLSTGSAGTIHRPETIIVPGGQLIIDFCVGMVEFPLILSISIILSLEKAVKEKLKTIMLKKIFINVPPLNT